MTTLVTIHGTGFKGLGFELGPSLVYIGPTLPEGAVSNVTDIEVVSDSEITCRLPERGVDWPHEVDMWVTTPFGTVHKRNAFEYDPQLPLAVTSIDPAYGDYLGGEHVVIIGTGFLGDEHLIPVTQVQLLRFGEVFDFTEVEVISDTEIHAVTPPGTLGYTYALRVLSPAAVAYLGNPALMNAFSYAPPSRYGDMSPNTGTWSGGQTVTMRRFPRQPLFTTLVPPAILTQDNDPGAYEEGPWWVDFTVVDGDTITFVMPNANDAYCSPWWENEDPYNPGQGRTTLFFKNAAGFVKMRGYFTYEGLRVFEVTDPMAAAGDDEMVVSGWALDTVYYAEIGDYDTFDYVDVTDSLILDSDHQIRLTTPDMTGIVNGYLYLAGAVEFEFPAGEQVTKRFTVYSGLEPIITELTPNRTSPLINEVMTITGANFAIEDDVACDDYPDSNQTAALPVYFDGTYQAVGQTFNVADGNTLKTARFNLSATGAPTGSVVAKLYVLDDDTGSGTDGIPDGDALATSDPVDISTLTADPTFAMVDFDFTGANRVWMEPGSDYVIVVEYVDPMSSASDCLNVGVDTVTTSHGGNSASFDGAVWVDDNDTDVVFDVVAMSWADQVRLIRDGGGPDSIPFVVIDDNTIAATVPAGPWPGAQYQVKVRSPYGFGITPFEDPDFPDLFFSYWDIPTVNSTSPDEGPIEGGTLLFISVDNNHGITAVLVDGVECAGFALVIGFTAVQAITPPHAAGDA